MLSFILYIVGWILITLLVIGATLIIFVASRTDKCRRSPSLYCYPDWKCAGSNATSATQIAAYQNKCTPDANGNLPSTCSDVNFINPSG